MWGPHEGAAPPAGHDEQVSASLAHVLEGKTWSALPRLRQRTLAHHADEVFVAVWA